MNGGHDISPSSRTSTRPSAGGMEHGAILGRVDPLAGDHRGEAVSETDFVCEGGEVVENRSRRGAWTDRPSGRWPRASCDRLTRSSSKSLRRSRSSKEAAWPWRAPESVSEGSTVPCSPVRTRNPDPAGPAVRGSVVGGGAGYSEASSPYSSSTLARAASTQPWISGSVAPSKVMTPSSSIRW